MTSPERNSSPSQQLQTLWSSSLLPTSATIVTQDEEETELLLDSVKVIEVRQPVQFNGRSFFAMDIYFRRHVPINQRKSKDSTADDRRPDLRVARRFSDFMRLRSAVYKLANDSHQTEQCQFCVSIVLFVVLGKSQPTLRRKWISSQQRRAKHLTAFMQQLLSLVPTSDYPCDCDAQFQIPRLLNQFIFKHPEE